MTSVGAMAWCLAAGLKCWANGKTTFVRVVREERGQSTPCLSVCLSARCHSVDDGRLLQTLRQHKDLVTCVAVSSDGRTVLSGEWIGSPLHL
jgi:hypothetical protein